MMLVIEGADCLGKTTLAKRVGELLGIPVVKKDLSWIDKSKLSGSEIEEHSRTAAMVLLQLAEHADFIVDRLALSSIVYSRAFDRQVDNAWAFTTLTNPDIAFVVITSRNKELWNEKIFERGEDLIEWYLLSKINAGFQSISYDISELRDDAVLNIHAFSSDIDTMATKTIDFFQNNKRNRNG